MPAVTTTRTAAELAIGDRIVVEGETFEIDYIDYDRRFDQYSVFVSGQRSAYALFSDEKVEVS